MQKKKNWYSLPKHEIYLLLFLIIYPTIFFLPWSYNIMFLNVSLLAWSALVLSIVAPVISIIMLVNEHKFSLKTDAKKNVRL